MVARTSRAPAWLPRRQVAVRRNADGDRDPVA
jgi:hypothetical protein